MFPPPSSSCPGLPSFKGRHFSVPTATLPFLRVHCPECRVFSLLGRGSCLTWNKSIHCSPHATLPPPPLLLPPAITCTLQNVCSRVVCSPVDAFGPASTAPSVAPAHAPGPAFPHARAPKPGAPAHAPQEAAGKALETPSKAPAEGPRRSADAPTGATPYVTPAQPPQARTPTTPNHAQRTSIGPRASTPTNASSLHTATDSQGTPAPNSSAAQKLGLALLGTCVLLMVV